MYKHFLKRFFDLCLAIISIIILSPLLLLVTIFLQVANKNEGAFLIQPRPGKNARIFRLYKFKTMRDTYDRSGKLLPDSQRLTRIGRYIRTTSIDELPQLLNIVKGDMSFVGPRPLLEKYLPLYSEEQSRRHDVRPGITGWAQCNGRNEISWEEKFKLDVWYADNVSFILDIKILILTIIKVLGKEGINSPGTATMEAFRGSGLS